VSRLSGKGGRARVERDEGAGDAGEVAAQGSSGDPVQRARAICLRLLTSRARTRAELASALAARDVEPDVAEQVLTRLEAVKLIDDAAFATDWVASRRRVRGLGRAVLTRELRQRGVAEHLIEQATADLDADDEHATAVALAERRLRTLANLDPGVQIRRLAAFLERRGYPSHLALSVAAEAIRGATR
jgi:regulatory protein